jgi:hypothetical protein
MRYELTDKEWTAIRPMLPNKARGVPRVNDRRVLNGKDLQDRRKPPIQLDKEPAIVVREPGPAAHLAPQNDQLMSERRVLCCKSQLRLE